MLFYGIIINFLILISSCPFLTSSLLSLSGGFTNVLDCGTCTHGVVLTRVTDYVDALRLPIVVLGIFQIRGGIPLNVWCGARGQIQFHASKADALLLNHLC